MDKRGLCLIFAVAFVFSVCSLAEAATTGKIVGHVFDQKGEPLPGANMVVEGTNRGATTDTDGYYLILSVDPGSYTLKASMVGYTPATKTDVRVITDITTEVDFTLNEATLELGELTVVAERPPVEADVTESRYVVTAEEIDALPLVRSMDSFVELEAGINVDGTDRVRNAYYRAAGNGEVAEYMVDGIRLTTQDGRNWRGNVNPSAIAEITVLAGGLNAEYGNIGSIQIVTRDGGRDYHGQVHYRFTPGQQQHWGQNAYESAVHRGHLNYGDPAWDNETDSSGRLVHQRSSDDYTDVRGHFLEGSLSGPIGRNAAFFTSTQHDFQPKSLPQPEQRTPFNTNNSYKVTFDASTSMRVRVGGLYSWNKRRVSSGFDARSIFLPENESRWGIHKNSDNMLYASFTQTVSARTFYEVRLSYYASKQDTSDIPGETIDPDLDNDAWYYVTPGAQRRFQLGEQNRLSLRGDLSSQVTRGHFLKAGFNLTRFDAYRIFDAREDTKTRNRRLYYYGKRGQLQEGMTPMELTGYIQDKMEFEGLIVNAGLRYERFWGADVPLYITQAAPMTQSYTRFVKYTPWGKMEPHQWILPRLGVSHPVTDKSKIHFFYGKYHTRPEFDLFFRNRWISAGQASLDKNGNGQIDPAEENNNLFSNDGFGSAYAANVFSFQDTQISTAFELGTEWNFISDYTLQTTAYYRVSNGFLLVQTGDFRDPGLGTKGKSRAYGPKRHATTRGLELALKKGLKHNFSFKAAINLGWGEHLDTGGTKAGHGSVVVYPDASFIGDPTRYWNKWTIDQTTGEEIPQPPTGAELEKLQAAAQTQVDKLIAGELGSGADFRRTFKLWEMPGLSQESRAQLQGLYALQTVSWRAGSRDDARRTNGSLVLIYASPPDFGPGGAFWGSKLFGDIRLNMIYRIYTGQIFIFTDPITNIKAKREGPTSDTVDISFQKGFNIRGIRPLLYVEINNLFNQQLMRTQAERTPVEYLRFGLLEPRPDDTLFKQFGDVDELNRFENERRQIFAGLRFTW